MLVSLNSKNIADIRKDYQLSALDEQATGDDPLVFFFINGLQKLKPQGYMR